MAQPYVGEIRMFAGNFAPVGWMFCEGQLLSISENEALFALIGTTYGGDGQETFALPDVRGRLPLHHGQGAGLSVRQIGESGGAEEVTLTVNQIAAHSHPLLVSTDNATQSSAANGVLAQTPSYTPYFDDTPNTAMFAGAVAPTGGSQPHTNFQPYLCVNFIISLFGIFPSPS